MIGTVSLNGLLDFIALTGVHRVIVGYWVIGEVYLHIDFSLLDGFELGVESSQNICAVQNKRNGYIRLVPTGCNQRHKGVSVSSIET